MERAIEIFVIISFAVIGISHVLEPRAWIEFIVMLRERGKAGVFAAAFLNLLFGSIIVAFHNIWSGIPLIVTLVGWAHVVKALIYFAFPAVGLYSFRKVSHERPGRFVAVGIAILVVVAVLGYHVWTTP